MAFAGLQSKVAVVTGGAGGIGTVYGGALVEAGAAVALADLDGAGARAAAAKLASAGHRAIGVQLDITDPATRPAVEALLRGADVVLHNFRVGVAERLGIDEETVARLNPGAVHCHASAFGSTGPRAAAPGNDALMQAVTGFERAIGGDGNDPTAATWIPIDMSGGWVAAAGILAGLYARAAILLPRALMTFLCVWVAFPRRTRIASWLWAVVLGTPIISAYSVTVIAP